MTSVPDILQQVSWRFDIRKYRSNDPDHPVKLCFVTVGATAPFNSLVREVLSVPFLTALQKQDYTHLLVQFGSLGFHVFEELKSADGLDTKEQLGVTVEGFDFNVDGLKQEMMAVKASPESNRLEGMIISHAGEALHYQQLRLWLLMRSKGRALSLKLCALEFHW